MTRSYVCKRLNLGYFRVLRNVTNQDDEEGVIKGEERGRKRHTRQHNKEEPNNEAKISSG